MRIRSLLGLAGLASVVLALPAAAAPVEYFFTGGSATITGDADGTAIISPTVIPIDGYSVTFDDSVPELTDLLITFPTSQLIMLTNPYGPYDQFTIDAATIADGTGFMGPATAGAPGEWTFFAVPLDIDVTYTASHSGGAPPPTTETIMFPETSAINGTINLSTMTLTLEGITLAVVDGSAFGEPDLIVKADITFGGAVPEPGTAALLSFGLLGIASYGRRRR